MFRWVTGNSRAGARLAIVALLVCLGRSVIGASMLGAAKPEGDDLPYLVARPSLISPYEPYFDHSVILMLPISSRGNVGIIVNRPTRIRLHELFPHNPNFKNSAALAYFGGPVDMGDVSLVFRSSHPPKKAIQLSSDVYITFDSGLITTMLKKPQEGQTLRLFLGYAGWGRGQLQGEIQRGSWYTIRANSDYIFNTDPERVWHTLLERARPGVMAESIR